jgi:hypothetical protein
MMDAAVGIERDAGLSATDARKSIDFVTHEGVASASDAFQRDSVSAEQRQEAVAVGRRAWAARREDERNDGYADAGLHTCTIPRGEARGRLGSVRKAKRRRQKLPL